MQQNIHESLKKYFGYDSFRPGQEEIIKAILKSEQVLAVLPTGAGKSLCYQLPALISDSFSIVISPLIALMKDQVDALNQNGEIAGFINSSLDYSEIEKILESIRFGKIKILYIAPERLENMKFVDVLKSFNPTYLFIDEAHCISEWGHDFRPSYRKINQFIQYLDIQKIAAFTATATPEVRKDICLQLGMKSPKIFVKGFERENIALSAIITPKKHEKTAELITLHGSPCIVYTSSRKKTEELSEYLTLKNIKNAYYHAGMNNMQRKRIQEQFLNDEISVIVATNAFGMGIDKKDVRLVIHYHTPRSVENYYQEFGRAGRDGKESHAFLLYDASDRNLQQFFIKNSYPDEDAIRAIYTILCNEAQIMIGKESEAEIPLSREIFSDKIKQPISQGILQSALRILANAGYVEYNSGYDKNHYIAINDKEMAPILKNYMKSLPDGAKKDLLYLLLSHYTKYNYDGRAKIQPEYFAKILEISPEQIDSFLDSFSKAGLILYEKPFFRESVKIIGKRILSDKLKLDFKGINDGFIVATNKLDQMINYVFAKECRYAYILRYFGQSISNYRCGKCDFCTTDQENTEETFEYLNELILRTIKEFDEGLQETHLYTILLGTSNSLVYRSLDTFAACANYERKDIDTLLQSVISAGYVTRYPMNRKLFLSPKGAEFLQQKYPDENKDASIGYEDDIALYHNLKEIRNNIAARFNQSRNIVCPEEVLRNVAQSRPETEEALLQIEGFTKRMVIKLGQDFLQEVKSFVPTTTNKTKEQPEKSLPDNLRPTFDLLKKGNTLKEIAHLRRLDEAVISMQVESIIEFAPDINIEKLIPSESITLIKAKIDEGITDKRELKKELPNQITYSEIRLVLAKYKIH